VRSNPHDREREQRPSACGVGRRVVDVHTVAADDHSAHAECITGSNQGAQAARIPRAIDHDNEEIGCYANAFVGCPPACARSRAAPRARPRG